MNTVDSRAAAFAFAASQDWSRALTEVRRALATDPEDAALHALLALALSHQKNGPEAVAAGRRAVALAPELSLAHYALGCALYEHDDKAGAEKAAREALRLEPDAQNYALLGQIMVRRNRWRDALSAAQEGLKLEPHDAGCANIRALALSNLGKGAEAERVVLESLAHDPDDASSHAEHGWLLLRQRRYEEALTSFQTALRLDPEHDRARFGIIEALKARSGLYRIVLRYSLWIGSFDGRTRGFIIIGLFFASRVVRGALRENPAWWPVLGPLLAAYGIFAVSTWLAGPISDLLLRLNPFGRLVLTRPQIVASNWVGGCLAVALAGGLTFAATGALPAIMLAAAALLLLMPVAGAFQGHGTRAWIPLLSIAAALGALGAIAVVAAFFSRDVAVVALVAMFVGVFVTQWIANYLLSKYG